MFFTRIRQWWRNRKLARIARRHPGFASGGYVGTGDPRYRATADSGCGLSRAGNAPFVNDLVNPFGSFPGSEPPMPVFPPSICVINVMDGPDITKHLDNPAAKAAFVAAIQKSDFSCKDDGGGSSPASSYESCTSSDSGSSYDSGSSSDSGGCSSGE